MENCKKVHSEILLPEAIIQHIQSFLTGKEAAKTSIFSKSWYSAWLTRPNLDFNRRDFSCKLPATCDENGFWKFANRTTQRYEALNRKIDSLGLRVYSEVSDEHYDIAGKLILKAMKLGATDIDFEPGWGNNVFTLPPEVLRSEMLTRLSLRCCRIDQGMDRRVGCSRLKSLNLNYCNDDDNIIQDIISSCRLIEELSLLFNDWREVPKFNRPMGFHKLKCLFLGRVSIDPLFFRDLSSNFPCLKDLSIHYFEVHGYKDIHVSSTSLECISFEHFRMLTASFDVPRLCMLEFNSFFLPNLSFKKYSREWKSHTSIEVTCPRTSWFIKLKEMLAKLSQHGISLSLDIAGFTGNKFDYPDVGQGLPTPIVLEDLVLRCLGPSSSSSAVVNGLFWSCRPKFITLDLTTKYDFLDTLCEMLIQRVSENSCIPLGLHDLEEVNVELFNKVLGKWRPLPSETLLCASIRREIISKIRFQLRWR